MNKPALITAVTPAQAGAQRLILRHTVALDSGLRRNDGLAILPEEKRRMNNTQFHRHAELVSASILPPAPASQLEKWTLKQVQGDGLSIFPEGSVG